MRACLSGNMKGVTHECMDEWLEVHEGSDYRDHG